MAYDPETLLQRYQQMLAPEEFDSEADEHSSCTEGCRAGTCQSCCVGLVEMVRQYSEQQATLETRSIEFDDIVTKANKLGR